MSMIPIQEVFLSFQGEGIHLGRKAFFIRTYGCPLRCPWCDAAGTWHPKYRPKDISRRYVVDLAKEAKDSGAEIVIVTGGEPTIHDLNPLVQALHAQGLRAHLETSGAFDQKQWPVFDWVTLSPKKQDLPCGDWVMLANELKFIIEKPEDILFWMVWLINFGDLGRHRNYPTIWLHPEWSQRENVELLKSMVEAVKGIENFDIRIGWQLHKLYRADALDSRAAQPVPLGGNPALGY